MNSSERRRELPSSLLASAAQRHRSEISEVPLFLLSRYSYFGGGYSWFCQKMDHSEDENSVMLVKLGYFYCIVRVLDLLDTIFFVLRKKFSQVSTGL